jgi:putative membrane protein
MKRFLVTTAINAIGLYVVTLLIPAIQLVPYGGSNLWAKIGSFLLVSAIFGLVNSIVAPIIKIVAFPVYLLTFGLISVVINGALLLFVAWLSSLFADKIFTIEGFTREGLTIQSLGWAMLGAIIMSISSMIAKSVAKKAARN